MQYILKECLFCEEGMEASLHYKELYQRSFSEDDLNADVFSARRATEHFHYRIVKCTNTGLVFSREILSDKVLGELYKDSKVTFGDYSHIIANDYWKGIRDISREWKKERSLDIGCSNGFFLSKLKKEGYIDVHGCEPSIEAKAGAKEDVKDKIFTGLFQQGIYPDNHFDLVTVFQTLDHLADPLKIMKTIHQVLKPGGHVYIIVHDVESIQARILGEKSPIIDVEHIYLFNENTLRMLGEKAGFKVIKQLNIVNSYPLKYWLHMTPIPMKGLFQKLSRWLFLENVKLPIRAGNIGVILQKP